MGPRRSSFFQASSPIRRKWLQASLPALYAMIWEELCREAISILSLKWKTPLGQAGRYWQGDEREWDVLAKSFDGKTLFIGEAKWTAKRPSSDWIHQQLDLLKGKGIPPIERHPDSQIIYALFIPEKPKGLILTEGTKVYDASEIIKVL